jgi:hypothetical protein
MATKRLVDGVVARYGHGLRRETVSRELTKMLKAGLVASTDPGVGEEKLWSAVDPADGQLTEETRRSARVTSCDHRADHESRTSDLVNPQASACDPCDQSRDRSRVTGVTAPYRAGGHTSHDGSASGHTIHDQHHDTAAKSALSITGGESCALLITGGAEDRSAARRGEGL